MRSVKKIIKEVQGRDEKTKRTYLYIASSLSMIVIVFLWIAYLNYSVPPADTERTATATATATAEGYHIPGSVPTTQQKSSFFQTFIKGFSRVSGNLAKGFREITAEASKFISELQNSLRGTFGKTNTFSIQNDAMPPDGATQPSETSTQILEEIPPTTLP